MAIHPTLDPELQAALAHHALAGLDRLLTACPAGERLESEEIGAIVRLIVQAEDVGAAA